MHKAASMGLSEPSDPLYANYAHGDNDPSRIFGENLPRLKQIAEKVDPERVMALAGGFIIQKDGAHKLLNEL